MTSSCQPTTGPGEASRQAVQLTTHEEGEEDDSGRPNVYRLTLVRCGDRQFRCGCKRGGLDFD